MPAYRQEAIAMPRRKTRRAGQGLVEYALVLVLIVLVVVLVLYLVGEMMPATAGLIAPGALRWPA
jgi:hypothetical protein